jgi:hypothetical protein
MTGRASAVGCRPDAIQPATMAASGAPAPAASSGSRSGFDHDSIGLGDCAAEPHPRRSEPQTNSTSPFSICVLSLEQQIDVHLHLPADRVATARQLHLPLEAELAAVEARAELQSRDLAEGGQSRWGVVTAGGDRARDAPDRELAVDLCPAVVGEANRRRAERDLGMALGIEGSGRAR